jgi:sulfate adenylyltransferase subunit 2
MAPVHNDYSLSQLDSLEAESIHIIREVAAEFERPVVLFSGGKDSIIMLAIAGHQFDAVFGGARRDEEKARAKERVFSFRDEFGQWDPKNQRPELWGIYNTRIHRGEHIRVFPLSNWTELDVWEYISRENLEIPSIYYAHSRSVFEREGILLADSPYITRGEDEPLYDAKVRYRTVGDMTCTGAVESTAATIAEVIAEIAATRITERGQTRADDRTSEAAMEDRKREGYF